MGWVTGILVYGVLWWLVFFMALPVGVKSQDEDETVVPGTHSSAPVKPHLWRKAAATSVIAALLWALVYLAVTQGWVSLQDTPR